LLCDLTGHTTKDILWSSDLLGQKTKEITNIKTLPSSNIKLFGIEQFDVHLTICWNILKLQVLVNDQSKNFEDVTMDNQQETKLYIKVGSSETTRERS
jgi:hypothetical protein